MIENFSTAVISQPGSVTYGSNTATPTAGSTGFVSGTVGTAGTGFSNHNMDISSTAGDKQ